MRFLAIFLFPLSCFVKYQDKRKGSHLEREIQVEGRHHPKSISIDNERPEVLYDSTSVAPMVKNHHIDNNFAAAIMKRKTRKRSRNFCFLLQSYCTFYQSYCTCKAFIDGLIKLLNNCLTRPKPRYFPLKSLLKSLFTNKLQHLHAQLSPIIESDSRCNMIVSKKDYIIRVFKICDALD